MRDYNGSARDYLCEYLGFDIDAARGEYANGARMDRAEAEAFIQKASEQDNIDESAPFPFTWEQLVDEIVAWVNEA